MPNIVAALRVKNEERWIGEVLDALKWTAQIYLFDDHSKDKTCEIAERKGARVFHSRFKDFDEARDKEHLTRLIAEKHSPQAWVLMIDGDEVLEPAGEAKIRRAIDLNPWASAFKFQIIYLWNSRTTWRRDGIYSRFFRPSLFKLGTDYQFKITSPTGNLHCSSVPAIHFRRTQTCDARILHLGYMKKEDRIKKWKYYNSIDPRNRAEGWNPAYPERGSYPWIVQGDIPEVPAEAILKYAGPLEVAKL